LSYAGNSLTQRRREAEAQREEAEKKEGRREEGKKGRREEERETHRQGISLSLYLFAPLHLCVKFCLSALIFLLSFSASLPLRDSALIFSLSIILSMILERMERSKSFNGNCPRVEHGALHLYIKFATMLRTFDIFTAA
jgi:hypothetical protein